MAVGPADGVVFRYDKAPFTDIRIRKALDMAIDRNAIAKKVYGGAIDGTPTGMISVAYSGWSYAYDDWSQSLKDEYAYNPTGAKALLAKAGYPSSFKTNVVTSGSMNELLEVFKAYFHDIGVEMNINMMDQTAFIAFTREGKHDQTAESNAGNSWRPTRTIEQYYSKGIDSGTNHISDPEYDAIREKFWSATTEAEAAAAMVEADRHAIEQHYCVFVVHDHGYAYWQPYLKGYSGEARGLVTMSYLWVDSDLKKSMGR